ncbi:BLUF domain-containing protein [Erythrobacter sp. QSSC1-22B]|uniref:BLUF domain-containing protein n=1 Tax=Erythrobacter sp. QSSC1-22B TaxID=1860125 RepID=UPI0009F6CD25|nr:BLUF domain-containing protein [Erythrobacter sp. QSSC1-22B]
MIKSILYVSAHQLEHELLEEELADIVNASKRKNGAANVSGALIATDRYFSQILQGPIAGVDSIIAAIAKDTRHEDIKILEDRAIEQRNCRDWRLAYFGNAGYINRQISPLIDVSPSESWNRDKQRVINMMREFCRP